MTTLQPRLMLVNSPIKTVEYHCYEDLRVRGLVGPKRTVYVALCVAFETARVPVVWAGFSPWGIKPPQESGVIRPEQGFKYQAYVYLPWYFCATMYVWLGPRSKVPFSIPINLFSRRKSGFNRLGRGSESFRLRIGVTKTTGASIGRNSPCCLEGSTVEWLLHMLSSVNL